MASIQPSSDPQWEDAPPSFGVAAYAQGPGVTRVALSGELDIAAAPCLGNALSEAAHGSVAVILDLSELTFMDSSGLHSILTARERLAAAGCRLVLLRGDHRVHRLFQLTGVERLLEFVNARDARNLAVVR